MYSSHVKHVIMYVSGAITSLVCWQIANGVTGIVHHIAIVDSFRFPIITRLGNSLLVLLGRTSGRYDLVQHDLETEITIIVISKLAPNLWI